MIQLLPSSRAGRVRLGFLLAIMVTLGFVYRDRCGFVVERLPVLYSYFWYSPQEGDIVFQSLPHDGSIVDVIEGITHSPYSHCGVVLRNDKGHWVVIESILNVHETPLFLWMLRGRKGAIAAYRFASSFSSQMAKFKENLLSYLGHDYDYNYEMANSQSVYCSDLIFLAFEKTSGEKMGKLEKLGDLDWQPYRHFIESDQGGHLPLDRVLITPASLALAPQLHQVFCSPGYKQVASVVDPK